MAAAVRLLLALLVAVLAVVWRWSSTAPAAHDYHRGRNNSALFLVIDHPGLSNVHLATAQSLLEQNPDIDIHFASFPALGKRLPRISSFTKSRQPAARGIGFHVLNGPSYYEALDRLDWLQADEDGRMGAITKPGLEGIKRIGRDMQLFLDPWNQTEHLALFNQLIELIDEIDPAAVVLDTIFSPAIEATRARNRVHAFITPNILVDNFPGEQPWLGMLWKYPAMGSGFPFPVPSNLILQNIYLNLRFISSIMWMPEMKVKRAFLESNGVPEPINFYGLNRPDVPWITQTTPAATIPVDFVPQNVSCVGPITIAAASGEEEDPELWEWIQQRPTVFINLGSAATFGRTQTRQLVEALLTVVETSDTQVVWKYSPTPGISGWDWKRAMQPLEATGRVRVTLWLSVDPFVLLSSGHIVAFVTHGGANGFHESIAAGVPQVVLPLWVDLFNYAQLAEQTGVGVWGCRETAPDWGVECLRDAIFTVSAGPDSAKYLAKAKEIGVAATKDGLGRDRSAAIIATLARSGRA